MEKAIDYSIGIMVYLKEFVKSQSLFWIPVFTGTTAPGAESSKGINFTPAAEGHGFWP